ncbi:dystonin isoform X34 [Hylaeus anthracinus]|uniref:dystonin isoform X34 n=1 Tax=Hylaeus anthracinus TaxID=313031 RepID=UPI0023B9ABEB|nr:dystonin isoform X34 [Hylaeus anthracinus]
MSTQAYYKERLGFDPADTVAEHHREQRWQHGYEESLSKFKGQNENGFSWWMTEHRENCRSDGAAEHRSGSSQAYWGCWAMFIEAHDERDAIQKKTFTKWVNKHLKKHWKYVKTYTCLHVCVLVNNQPCCSPTASRHVGDLFEDLRDGHNLISLLEVLSGEHLPRERGRMRFHMLQNVQMALDFLRYKKIKLVNIRAEDIVDGNPKLTLGLIWTIILHFQSWRRKISDIVVGQEPNVTAREALLRWARRSTARYPGVRVTDFTGSWRDGLAFSALIHRNRPDLVDWRGARTCQPRERLDRVFHVAEREYGVTRLLDPEDVDTPEPDEKSLITYISSLYDVFPEPPAIHPLYDAEAQRRSAEYRELASSLHLWIREKMSLMQERAFPPTLIEMKKLAADSAKFKNDEVPPRYRDKQRLSYIFRDLQKYFEAVGEVDMEPELHIDIIEKNWHRLMTLHQEREQAIIDEIKRLERLQRLAEKVHREMKTTDNRLEELERRVEDEARRLDRLHPLEAKHAVDLLEQDIRNTETQIQNIFTDVHTLTEGRYSQAAELHKRVQKLHQRWVALRSLLHKRLVQPLSAVSFPVEERVVTKHRTTVHETRLVDTNPHFRALHDCIDWCKAKIKQLQEADYGSDLPSVQNELDVHQREHKNIEQFHPKVDRCLQSKSHFHGEELTLYSQHLAVLQKLYAELLSASNKRLSDLDTLHDFIQSATGELVWLSSKEETEVTRDWSDKNLNVQSIEQYYERTYGSGIESLMSDLEKREIQFSAVQDRGEALVLQHHPAAKTIEAYMSAMQSQWAWLLQLTLCLEVHLKHAAQSQQFFREIQQAEQWITKRDETLNTIYSQSDFSLDEGERLLKGMQELREELNSYGDHVQKLVDQAKDVVPMKQRRQPVTRPIQVTCVCSYKQVNMSIEKGEQCTLYDNSGRIKWRVKNQEGVESPVPGVCFALQPPDKDALDAAERLRRQYDRSVALWQRKQLRLRQNMIFATIKVVKGWDLPQFLAMGQDQRTAIRKALNEDAEKLLSEGDPADPQLRRLKREMAEVNKLFDELEKRARAEEESKNAGRIFNEQVSALQQALDEAERILNARIAAALPRDLDSLEHLVLQHKDYEQSLRRLAPDLDRVQQTFRVITLKTPAMRNKLDAVTNKWNHIWNASNLYIERLKCVEIVLSSLEENTTVISEFEIKLASFDELPADLDGLQNVLEDLRVLQNAITQQQSAMDQLNEDAHNARRLVEKSRPSHRGPHTDMDRLDAEVNRLNARWTNVCGQLVDRVRSAEAAYTLAQQMEHAYRNEVDFVDESYAKLEVENAKNLLNRVVERAPAIEAVNVTGGRLIREGKIYGQRLRAFKEQLEDICPSMDATVKKPRRERVLTVDHVARDLDTLNKKYTTLVNILQERVRQMATLHPEDASLQRALQEQRPLRTFRTEFNIYESSTCEERYTSTTTHYTQSQYSLERHERTERTERTETVSSDTTRRSSSQERSRLGQDVATVPTSQSEIEIEREKITQRRENDEKRERSDERDEASWSKTSSASGVHFSEIRSLKRIERADEGIGTENVIEARGIVDPRTGNVLTVGEAISLRILDVRRGRIACSKDGRKTVTIEEAAREKMIDPRLADRLLGPCGFDEEGRPVSLLEAIQRELYDAEKSDGSGDRAKQAVEEKYKLCDETSSRLLQWISEVEDKLAKQDNVKEDVDQLRSQINAMKEIKEDLEAHARPVSTCLDQIRQVVLTGSNVLSSEEVSTLERNGRSLKTRFDKASDRTERMVKRLIAARDELVKFKNELSTFSHWLDNARRVLEEKEHSLSDLNRLNSSTDATRDFISDVIAHQADLRFITMAAQKFVDESKEFLHVLNEFRTSLPQRLPHKEPVASQDSPVRGEVSIVTAQYKDLLSRANLLSDKLSGVGGRQRDYRESLEKARSWLKEVEPKVHRAISEAVAAEPKQVEDQLSKAKALNNEMLANERLVENVKVTVEALLRSLDGQLTPKEVDELEEPARALEDKYRQLTNAIAEKCQELDAALVRSQGVQDALDSLVLWLNNIESQFKNIQRPASLQKERLEEQQRDQRLLQADLDSHRLSVESVASSARDLLTNSSNARIAKRIEGKLKDVQGRFEKLMDKSLRRGEFLDEIAQALGDFLVETSKFDSWYAHMIETLESRDLSKLNVTEYESKMVILMDKREDQRASFEDLIRNGKNLISKKDVTDVAPIRDKIKALESQWKEVNNLIDEKQRLSKSRAEQLSAYEKLRDQVIDWLTRTESKVQGLEPVAVDLEKLKRQADELKPVQKEYRDYGNTVNKVNDLGIAYDGLLKERTESPTRRRGSTSPTKRPVRRMSQDGRSPSPAKLYAAQSPVSPGGSSGFSSRRSSQDGFHLEDLSPVQQQLSEINNRYELLGVRLSDRQTELDNVKDELRRHMDNLKTLSQFLEKIQRQIPKESMPSTKEEADKTAKQIKIVIEEMYEKQSLLDTTRTQVRDLVRRKKGADGVDRLNDEMEDVASRWRSFSERCKDRIKFLDDVKDFYDTSEGLVSWLGSKERMMGALGPISADPRMVASQVQQVQVLREEFRTQQPQLDHLVQVGESILGVIGTDSADGQRTSAKLRSILDKWSDQLARLDERAQSLGDAVDTSREFDASLNRLRDALQAISDNLDELTLEKDPEDQLRKIENLERQLEGQRPLLADAEAAGEQLCEVLSDPASKSEIHGKLAAVGKLYTNLQKKLDHKKAEIEGNLRDGRQFEASCTKTLGWLADELGNMSEKLLVSADRDILQQQLDHHEPIYRNVMGKEHEVIMLLNKGRDMLARSQKVENRSLQRDLDKMHSQWDRLKKDLLDRHTKLQTCAEHCKKYYKAQDTFLPWLRQAEDKLECLKPASFKRKDIEKQLKELASFRNEVWKHSGEFENNKTLGETFLGACDIDKQNVKNELGAMKTRWDKLNNDLSTRTQSLEDTARHLMDFNENLRDLRHGLQRCEDKLASHDALGGAAKDPKLLDRIKSLREETTNLKKPLQCVKQQASDLAHKAGEQGVDATHLQDEVENLTDRINDLQAKLDDRCNELQSAATAMAQFNDHVKSIGQNVSSLEKELDSMRAPGREIKLVRSQIEDTTKVISKVNRLYEEVTDLESLGERLVDYGFAADAVATREQVAGLKRQIGKLDDRTRDRHDELTATLDKLQEFYQAHTTVISEIDDANEEFRRFRPVGSEVESIKAQQEDFRLLKIHKIEPLARAVEDCNAIGQSLIQTAGRDVSTSNIEKDVDKMNDKWNDLKDRLNERDRRLDVGLLQSGKFQEALDGLEKWLTDTEEMVSNQKPPSSDYKVVKAQLQEQKFLKKMLMDRQNSMSSLYNMGQEVAAGADPKERKMIEKQLKELVGRFDNLTESAAERMEALEQAMGVAKQFQDKLVPLAIWLDKTEKRVRDMELVPTDEEKIQQRVTEHDALHEDILSRKPDFSELTEIASQLMALVGEDEASTLADKLQDAADRYAALVERSEALGGLLQRSRQGLRHLVLSYQELQAWMEGMEIRLSKYRVLAVHTEKLLQQMEDLADLTEEVSTRQTEVDSTTDAGLELMKHISSDEALQLKDKLDSLQRRFNDLVSRGSDLLKHAQESLPLVQQFHDNHNRLMDWMQAAESALQSAEPREDEIVRLEMEISEYRPVLDKINAVGPQLSQLSPGEGAATIEGLVTRDNRRFDAIAEQIQRKAERIQLSKQRSLEVIGDIDDLLEWFREVDNQLREAEPPSSEPEIIRVQLKEHKALNDDISSQKGRVRDVISTAKKVIRENGQHEDTSTIREKMEDLRETMEIVSGLSADRLGALEQALPLAEHLRDTHIGLVSWLEEAEQQVAMLPMPALRPDLIAVQQDKNELLMQSINEHKPLVEKLNKTGEALIKLCNEEEGIKIQDILEADTTRYAALRAELRSRQQTLEQALQESSQFSDKLEGMLRALSSTADQVHGAEPISAHPGRLRDQMEENTGLIDELAHRSEAYAAVRRAADDVISKAGNRADPAVKDIKRKLEKLNKLWSDVQKATNERGHTLDDALSIAEKFWSELNGVMSTLRELQDALAGQAPPAAQPAAIQQQQVALQEIRHEIDQTKPDVEQVRASGHELMGLCGEPDKPEVRKHIEDLDQAWDNVTALYARREENLIDAMEKAMEFHETLHNLLEFLEEAEEKFARMGPLGSDIDEVKKQIKQLANFKAEVDPHMVKVEALNRSLTRQAAELTERTSSEQAAAIKEPLGAVNKRWDGLLRGLVERQRLLENALLRLGQFQHALDELLVWIEKTDDTLDNLKAVAGDPQVIEVELAKLKVLVNDIQAHQTSVDTLNDAGRQLIEDGKGTAEASTTAEKLGTLNRRWRDLLQRAADRQRELEDALREAQSFTAEIQDLLSWLGDVDNTIVASKPVGGLPETASEQLERFMEVFNELEQNRPKVETVLQQGQEYLKRADSHSAGGLNHNLKTLKQRWDNVTARASDKKIKLEIALKEATEFHDALQAFVDWLTNAEKVLTNLKPVSRVMETILGQIEEHKTFQKDVGVHRETMLNLDKKGTHLKYFSQKQDVILIKNLLISVQHRWERVVSKSAERTRSLDHGYKEAREFHDAWSNLMNWLVETEKTFDEVAADGGLGGNDPERIKARLNKHRELQKALSAKQGTYDTTMKNGKTLKDKAPKTDEFALKELLNELKNKWTTVCGKCVDRQRKLEEALLFSGQFKDAIQALLEWLSKSEKQLANMGPLHGDLDTVVNLVEQHKTFERDLESRASQMVSVIKTGRELLDKATPEDASCIGPQLAELNDLWNAVSQLSSEKTERLEDALRDAERLHKAVHVLLEWLRDAEMKLRFAGQLPEDEQESRNQLMEHEKFLRELRTKEIEKDQTLELAHAILAKAHPDGVLVIRHWITIIQSRWEEVATWAHQRNQRLENHMQGLQDLDNLLEELLSWLEGLENTLNALEAEPLPDDKATLEMLIADHREFMENTSRRQNEVDRVCKARQIKHSQVKDTKKISKAKSPAPTRASPGRERTPDSLPHIGPRFPPKGSKGAEPEFRSPRVKLLWDRWRHVWMLAWERQRRLQDKYNYILELDRVANFSWEDWRKRFLKFMNHKKSRLTDLFRKMDKNNDGLIPREDFIQGIMNTKFETSRLEMGAVADLFDRHGEGLIDWKEFIAALRPDWEERRTYNDTDKIHDEVKRLVMLCTCRQKFRVFQVGEGKYRFGDSQKLRLVRILRSTVMVRVGGGWVALDEFLLKNDPCRVFLMPIPDPNKPEQHEGWCPLAKGRTNIELREQFILADGVSQTMTAFRSKPSPTSTLQRTQISSANTGPITKVRERSARSVPMGQTRASRSSLSAGTPDSLSDNESSFRIGSARKTSTPYRSTITPGGSRPSSRPASRPASRPTSRPGSRPASRQGSKPPSRYGSTQSLDSTDDSANLSRIPRRTTVSTTGNTPTSSRHNSVSGKRLGTPVNGSSSRPRTPTGLVSPASGVPARFGTIHRASSIPTLTGVGTPISRSRIPVYIGADIKSPQSTTSNISTHSTQSNDSTVSTDSTGSSSVCTNSATNTSSAVKQDRTRTPSSGSSTPLPPSLKLSRKPSGASDTSVSTTPTTQRKGRPTPIDQRAPFRL